MALTIDASGITTISSAETTTGWTGPTLAQESEIIKEGTFSLSSIVRNDAEQEYYTVTSQDYSNQHLRLWVSTGVYGLMNTTGKTGLKFFVSSGTNQDSYWNIADSSTYQGGWINIVVDANNPDVVGATITAINDIGIEFGLTASAKRVVNTYVDYLRYGNGYTAYGTSWVFNDIVTADVAAGYGIVTKYEGGFFLTGALQIGRSSEATTISEVGSVISFVDAPVDPTLYGITLIGNASSTFNFEGNVFTASGSQNYYLDFDDAGIIDLTFKGNTVQKASTIHFRASSTQASVTGNVFDGCGTIYPQGCTFTGNNIKNSTGISATVASDLANINGNNFTSDGSSHAVELTSIGSGSMNWDCITSGYDSGSTGSPVTGTNTGNEDIFVNVSSGTLTINSASGATIPSIKTAGATVNVVAGQVTTKIIVKTLSGSVIQGARVFVQADSGGPLPFEDTVTISQSGGTATVSHTAHGLSTGNEVLIKGANENNYNGAHAITVTGVDSYTYSIDSGTPSPASGSITSTAIIINGLTDSSGEIQDTRSLSSNQPIVGKVRKSTTSPYYKTGPISGTIDTANGVTISTQLVLDE